MEKIKEIALEKGKFIDTLGLEIREIRKGYVKGFLKIEKKHTNPLGAIHGGCLYSVADTVAGMAADTHGEYVVTASSSFTFLASTVDTVSITAEAEEVRYGRKISVYNVEIRNEHEELIAIGTYHFYNTEKPIE